MAHQHFISNGRFSEGAAERLVIKQRVIPESSGPARRIQDPPLNRSAKGPSQLALFHQSDYADKSRRPVCDAVQPFEQQCIVFSIRCVRSRETRRMHARFAVKSVNFKSGIVSKQILIRKAAVVLRLADRVFFESLAGFLRRRYRAGKPPQLKVRGCELELP